MSRPHTGRTRLRQACAIAVVLASPIASLASTTTPPTPFTVTMTISASCAIVSAGTMTFPNSTTAFTTNTTATSSVVVQCTSTTPYNIGLDAGAGSGATVATRKMTSGAVTINYSLYSDSNHTLVWGNTVGTNTVSQTGNGQNQSVTIFGLVPPQNAPAPGAYSDTVNVTVTY